MELCGCLQGLLRRQMHTSFPLLITNITTTTTTATTTTTVAVTTTITTITIHTTLIFMLACVNSQCVARASEGSICIRPTVLLQMISSWMTDVCAFGRDRQNYLVKHGGLECFVLDAFPTLFSGSSGRLQPCQSTPRDSTELIFIMPALLHETHGSKPRAPDPAWPSADRKRKLKLLTPAIVAEGAVSY